LDQYGEPPWRRLNEILQAAGLPFYVREPPELAHVSWLKPPPPFQAELVDRERDKVVTLDHLSAGEKVIVATAFLHYNAEHTGQHPRLLLLDEPDAHLHPQLTRSFLNVLRQVFVEKRGVRIIMTTHSATTVALTPEECLFEMRRTESPRIEK